MYIIIHDFAKSIPRIIKLLIGRFVVYPIQKMTCLLMMMVTTNEKCARAILKQAIMS